MADNAQSGRPARGASIFNLGLSALAAGALGFLVFAMPENVFSDLIVQSGLPGFLPSAEPPLGMKARAAVIAAVALLVFALVLLLLRGVDRLSARPAKAAPEPALAESEAPRLRRADAHPDAPAPRPILAGRDLGSFGSADEYDYPPDEDDEMFADLPAQPLPGFLTADRVEPAEERHFDEAPPEEHFEAAEIKEPEPEEAEVEEEGFEAPQAEEEPLVLDTPADDLSIEAMVSQLPEPEESQDNSITSLMHRLETGLVRREDSSESVEPEAEAASPPPSWLAPQPAADEPEQSEAAGPEMANDPRAYEGEEQSSPPPSWLAPQPAAQVPEIFEAEEPEAEGLGEAGRPEAFAPAPAVPTAANFPAVDEFGEPSWPAPRADEQQFAPLGAPHRDPSAGPKIQALSPKPVQSAPAEVEAPAEMSIGRRLRSAIADMDKIASSGG